MARYIILLIGVFACSTSVIWIKLSNENPYLVASYRLLIAALFLTPGYLKALKKHQIKFHIKQLAPSLVPGILLGIHFISWIIGSRLTFAGNASLIVNMVPVVMPFYLLWFSRERVNKQEILGTAAGLSGVLLLGISDYHLNSSSLKGDVICFLSMLIFALYLAFAKKKSSKNKSVILYLVPLYYIAGLFCFIIALFTVNPFKTYTGTNLLCILALAVIPTVVGHSILNHSMQKMRGQVVSIINLSQFIFASIMALFIFQEIPNLYFYFSCFLIIAGSIIVIHYPSSRQGSANIKKNR